MVSYIAFLVNSLLAAITNTIFSPIVSVQLLLSRVLLFATPRTAARQASLSITNSRSLPKLMSVELVLPSNHLILCRPLLLPPSIFPSIRVFASESVLSIRYPKYQNYSPWNFSRPEYWNGQPFPFPGDLPNPRIKPRSPALQEDSSPAEPQGKPIVSNISQISSQVGTVFMISHKQKQYFYYHRSLFPMLLIICSHLIFSVFQVYFKTDLLFTIVTLDSAD